MSGFFQSLVTRIAAIWSTLAASGGAALIGFLQSGSGAVKRTVQDEILDNAINVRRFGVLGDGSDEYSKITAAWVVCLATGKDLYFPAGTYSSGTDNMPFKHTSYPATDLFDCKNITIFGEGPNTILRSDSVVGADVLNLYSVKNLHIRNLKVTASISGSAAGSNGVSVVGGFDNVTLDHIWCENLPYVDNAWYLDGGKALTIQPGTPATECGTLKATNIFANGCVYGAGLEVDLVNWATKKHSIEIDVVAENCYQGVIFSAAGAASALSAAMTMGYSVKAKLINCQRNVVVGRAHGVDIEARIITTKTAAQKRLNPTGGSWNSIDAVVDGITCTYAKNSRLVVSGDIGGCDYKAQIGGASQGSSGLSGATEFCEIAIDLGGTAAVSNIIAVDYGGNTMASSRLKITSATGSIPADFFLGSKSNDLEVIGQYAKKQAIRFPATQVSSADANTLDDYEEGSFTATLADTSLGPSSEGSTYANNTGYYTKIGNLVSFNLYLAMSSLGTLATAESAYIIGLPYASSLSSGNLSACSIAYATGLAMSAGEIPNARVGSGDQFITLGKWPAAGTAGAIPMTVGNVSATGVLIISGQYRAAT